MKIRFANLTGSPTGGFVVEAENSAEADLLAHFLSVAHRHYELYVANSMFQDGTMRSFAFCFTRTPKPCRNCGRARRWYKRQAAKKMRRAAEEKPDA